MWYRVTIIVLACLLLAAHFLRFDHLLLTGVSLCLPLLLLGRNPITIRLLQGALTVAAIEWTISSWSLVQQRLALGQDYIRLSIIMASVIAFTLLAVKFSGDLTKRFKTNQKE
ncbi:hypothetical protein [Paraferrimonas haliotis]|uniref:hypothetical protein n=1 Tax=Paraferrimonas haliotis TaxID=2013866 RepID=UPI000BA906DD|nr:hypothetical protein [Paraferrimonas haliotis]